MRQVTANYDCTKKVNSCGPQPKGGILSCHRFYKCIKGVAYSCQNPKWRYSTCSEKYWSGKNKYRCPSGSRGAKDPCDTTELF